MICPKCKAKIPLDLESIRGKQYICPCGALLTIKEDDGDVKKGNI